MLQKTCSRCGEVRPIVVFVNRINAGKVEGVDGYCLRCARELKIEPIASQLERMGISDEEIEEMENQMQSLMQGVDEFGSDDEGHAPAFDLGKLLSGMIPMPQNKEEDDAGETLPVSTEKTDRKQEKRSKRDEKKAEDNRKYLNQFCLDLTKKARENALDRVIGREMELDRVIQILSRRTKNNPCLIGEPGVGKTAIAEALAQRIADGTVPYRLKNREIFVLDMTALVAGTQFRGQFENRIRALLTEVKKCGNVILMIDEIHTLVSAGDAEGGMNAANILKPALSRGEIQVIGATTLVEYRKHIEKDAALERRFQPVLVEEPSIAEAIEILNGIAPHYEAFHRIGIPPVILADAVRLSERYITDRFLPDKAIDLIDEAASRASLNSRTLERLALLTDERAEQNRLLEEAQNEAEPTDETYARIAHAKTALATTEEEFNRLVSEKEHEVLTRDDLAAVIEVWTGIPAASIRQSEWEKIATLDAKLAERIKGQEDAIDALCRAIRRARAGISPKRKPASFLFAGPTGVGKTELVKQLAIHLFDSEEALIRLDMSEYMEKHAVSRIIGSPPGYVGYDEAGQLTEKVRRKPYSVVLFDEIEKAHPEVLNVLLQILDDGRITDSHGKRINFENTVIVMTTNAGSGGTSAVGFSDSQKKQSAEHTKKALLDFLRPEFLNRIDEIVTFAPLNTEILTQIAAILLSDLKDAMRESGLSLSYTEEVCAFAARASFNEKFGARELRRYLQKHVEDKIASLLISSYRTKTKDIFLSVENDSITVTTKG